MSENLELVRSNLRGGPWERGAADPSRLSAELRRELERAIRACGETRCPGGRFPSYMLTNLSGNISRNRKRLAHLQGRP
jgi:hypothetical protein